MKHNSVNIIFRYLLLSVLTLSFLTCREFNYKEVMAGHSGKSEGVEHATGFEVEIHDGYRILRVFDPWQGASNLTFEYLLVNRGDDLPDPLPDGTLVRTPVNSVICLSTTHIAMLDLINTSGKITGASGSQYIYNERIRKGLSSGEIPDIGYDTNLDYELILQLQPDIILAYGVGAEAGSYVRRLQSLGIKVVLIGEYLERSPLAQAEWIKFVAHFFNKHARAEKKFRLIEEEYNKLVDMVQDVDRRPVVLTGLPWRNSWFVPGGKSLFAELIADAGGQYIFEENTGRENFPVNMETIFNDAEKADFWINTGTAQSMRDIKNTDQRLTYLRPFRSNSVYNNNARVSATGGNDFWESGIVNPHLVLKDLINILHPDLIDYHQWVYYRKL